MRPVYARASRRASIVPSVPELSKRTCSAHGIRSWIRPGPLDHPRVVVPEMEPLLDGLLDRLDRRVRVTQEQGAVAHAVVDVLVAVDVPLARPRACSMYIGAIAL